MGFNLDTRHLNSLNNQKFATWGREAYLTQNCFDPDSSQASLRLHLGLPNPISLISNSTSPCWASLCAGVSATGVSDSQIKRQSEETRRENQSLAWILKFISLRNNVSLAQLVKGQIVELEDLASNHSLGEFFSLIFIEAYYA